MIKQIVQRVMCTAVAAVFMAGCASTTQITNEWRSPDVETAGPYSKVFVAAITSTNGARNIFEDAFHKELTNLGVSSEVSYKSLSTEKSVEKEAIVKAVKDTGADAVLVIRLLKKETHTDTLAASPVSSTWGSNDRYYSGSWVGASFVDYTYDVFELEAKLFDTGTEKLVRGISTESIDPQKMDKSIAEYAKLIVERLNSAGLLKSSRR